jgi:pimeloyl-[acyl-carrier protein] methyl ester esterase
MTCHIESTGSGPDLVLIHGWGMHGGLWEDTAEALRDRFRVHRVDLPGHGLSPYSPIAGAPLAAMAEAILRVAPATATWVGWSLGGLICQWAAAHHPRRLERLVLVASTARFTQAADWPHGMAPAVLEQFANELEQDYRGTLNRFLGLQVRGSERAREDLRRLRRCLFEHGEPDPRALRAGLEILRHADLREELAAIRQPVLMIMGDRDTLIPVSAGTRMWQRLADGHLEVLTGAGHAPFLSHAEDFVGVLSGFLSV